MRRPGVSGHASAMWSRIFALVYEPALWLGEVAGMRKRRHELLAQARGRVLEVGAGTGLNLAHDPAAVTELIVAEPDDSMRRRLERRARGRAAVLAAPAERLPLDDASVDTVVSTLVLCTVRDPDAALREIRRVLRPGGRLLLIEHVRSDVGWRAWLQRRLRRPWAAFACGCRCDQPTAQLLHAAGFRTELHEASWRAMPAIIGPVVVGTATPA